MTTIDPRMAADPVAAARRAADVAEPEFGRYFMEIHFHRAVRTDAVCTGRILHGGRRIVHLESRLFDNSGRLAASATGSWFRQDAT
jgi:acyl-coenzyme A thioesterase PaaI-like protein